MCVYLHYGEVRELSSEAKRQIDRADELLISPMVLLEFDYLFQRKRIATPAKELYATLNTSFGISICAIPFGMIAAEAIGIEWTMDPFDRLIVASALVDHRSPLITRDRLIRDHYAEAVW